MSDQEPTMPAVTPEMRLMNLMLWMDLGGTVDGFETWMSEPRRTWADAGAQLRAAGRGGWPLLLADTNPPANQLLDLCFGEQP